MTELSALAIRLCRIVPLDYVEFTSGQMPFQVILLLGAFENLVPAGGMQRTAQTGFGLAFVSYTVAEIVGIIGRLGV